MKMSIVLAASFLILLTNCGRKAPLTPVPGTLLGDVDFSMLTAPVTPDEEVDVFDLPNVDEAWFDTTPSEDDDDEDEEEE